MCGDLRTGKTFFFFSFKESNNYYFNYQTSGVSVHLPNFQCEREKKKRKKRKSANFSFFAPFYFYFALFIFFTIFSVRQQNTTSLFSDLFLDVAVQNSTKSEGSEMSKKKKKKKKKSNKAVRLCSQKEE